MVSQGDLPAGMAGAAIVPACFLPAGWCQGRIGSQLCMRRLCLSHPPANLDAMQCNCDKRLAAKDGRALAKFAQPYARGIACFESSSIVSAGRHRISACRCRRFC
jgi:hypothetical protein